jgi:hypothetical protein
LPVLLENYLTLDRVIIALPSSPVFASFALVLRHP